MLRFEICIFGAASGPLGVTFETAFSVLSTLDRLFIELDGSFVCRGSTNGGEAWQVDGNLMDRGDCLAFVELKGRCPVEQFDLILRALGWPVAKLAFQLPRRGVTLSEADFREMGASAGGAI